MSGNAWDGLPEMTADEVEACARGLLETSESMRLGHWRVYRNPEGGFVYRVTPEGIAAIDDRTEDTK